MNVIPLKKKHEFFLKIRYQLLKEKTLVKKSQIKVLIF